jgi:KDO2-lipid IV(A) lauroyltransferase
VVADEDETVSVDGVDEERLPTFQDRFEYLLLRVTGAATSILPRPAALTLASFIGIGFFDLLRIRRNVTLTNLSRAYPESTRLWRRQTARAAYVNLAVVSVEMLRSRSLDVGKVKQLVYLEQEVERQLRSLIESRNGAVIVGGHYGTWELLGARLAALGYPSVAIMQDQRNPLMNRELNRARARLGLEVVERQAAPRKVVKTLRDGGVVLIVGDQDAGDNGIFVEFFGQPAATTTGPAWFAARSGAAFIGAWIHRVGPGYRMGFDDLEAMEPAASPASEPGREERVHQLTATYMRWLEGVIRFDPGQYLWLHRRWKTQPGKGGP